MCVKCTHRLPLLSSLYLYLPLPLPRPLPLPPPVLELGFLGGRCLGLSSINSCSKFKLSGKITKRMLLPRIDKESKCCGVEFGATMNFIFLRCVFMEISTPTTVPVATLPFFNSIVTVSPLSFIKNRTNFIAVCGCLLACDGSTIAFPL